MKTVGYGSIQMAEMALALALSNAEETIFLADAIPLLFSTVRCFCKVAFPSISENTKRSKLMMLAYKSTSS